MHILKGNKSNFSNGYGVQTFEDIVWASLQITFAIQGNANWDYK